MWLVLNNLFEKRREDQALKELGQEIARNLESCYVMQQLGQLRTFSLQHWQKFRSVGVWPNELLVYADRLEEFNQRMTEAQEYERWYLADIDRQNQINAQRLHDLKEAVQEKFLGMEQVIKDAGNAAAPVLGKGRR